MKNLKLFVFIFISLTLTSCNQGIDATCSSYETQVAVNKILLEKVESLVSDQKNSDGIFVFDIQKIRASLAQIQISLESVRTVTKDTNSSKRFCTGILKITIPTTMFNEVEKSRELSEFQKISQYARQLNIESNVNVFTQKQFQYNVQPTDDKKELYVEAENTIAVSIITEITTSFLLKPVLEEQKAKKIQQEIEQKKAIKNIQKEKASFISHEYSNYENSKFNFVIQYPSDLLFPQGESDNGDGQYFISKDSKIKLTASGSYNTLDASLEGEFNDEARGGLEIDPHKVITYKFQKNNWFVVSGHRGSQIFYKKQFLIGDHFIGFSIEYPEYKDKEWKEIVSKISANFKSE